MADRYDPDPLYEDAKEILKNDLLHPTMTIQRKLFVGYNRACRLIEQLVLDGFIERYKDIDGYTRYRLA